MLAKIWKKFLLAICIIACLFNITSKLVNRKSLKANLESIKNGISLTDMLINLDKEKNKNTANTDEDSTSDGQNIISNTNIEEKNTPTIKANTSSNKTEDGYIVIY